MKSVYSIVCLVVIFGLVTIATTSCKKASGGGIVGVYYDWDREEYSNEPLGKATFGFRMECKDLMVHGTPTAAIVGELQYNDHYNKIKFHGRARNVTIPGCTCDDLGDMSVENEFFATGVYTPLPKGQFKETDDSGIFNLYVIDSGEGSSSGSDEFGIDLLTGYYGGYTNGGLIIAGDTMELQGGNIQVFTD